MTTRSMKIGTGGSSESITGDEGVKGFEEGQHAQRKRDVRRVSILN